MTTPRFTVAPSDGPVRGRRPAEGRTHYEVIDSSTGNPMGRYVTEDGAAHYAGVLNGDDEPPAT